MNCPRCGTAYQPGAPFCPSCGFKLILQESDFTALAEKARAYYRELNAGRLTQEQYNAAAQALTLPDPAGGHWTYQPGSRQWLWHDGSQWQRRDPPIKETGAKKPILIGAAIGFLLIVVAGIIFLVSFLRRGGTAVEQTAENPVAAMLLAIGDQSPAFSAYVGDPVVNPLILPAGVYYVEVMTPDGAVVSLGMEVVEDDGDGDGEVRFPTSLMETGDPLDAAAAAEFKDLLDFMLLTDAARLTYYGIVTADYTTLPYTMEGDIQISALQPLFSLYDELAAREGVLTVAAQSFQQRALDSASAFAPDGFEGRAGKASPRQWISMLDKLRIFCGLPASAQGRAQQEIIKAFSVMNDVQRQEAMQALEDTYGIDLNDPDKFIERVNNGELQQNILRIREDLYQDWDYQGAVQNITGANRPGLDTARQEGAALVEAGANLYVEVIKVTLDTKFPGIKTGFGHAENLDKWGNYIRDFINDPDVALERFTLDQIKDMIKDNVKDGLSDLVPGLGEDEIDEAAGVAADHIMDGIKNDLQTRIDEYTANVETTQQAAASATAEEAANATAQAEAEETESPPDYSWIEGYVAGVVGELTAAGYEAEDVNEFANDLRGCLTRQVDRRADEYNAKDNCADRIERFIKNPPPTEEYFHFGGSWHSPVLCGEDDDPAYRWNVYLSEDASGMVTGTISFHACPGGGAAYYSVSGQNMGEKVLVLQATRTDGRGGLWTTSMRSGEFRIEYMGPPQPNYAP